MSGFLRQGFGQFASPFSILGFTDRRNIVHIQTKRMTQTMGKERGGNPRVENLTFRRGRLENPEREERLDQNTVAKEVNGIPVEARF